MFRALKAYEWIYWYVFYSLVINVWTEGLKWRLMLRQMRESMFCETIHVEVASHTWAIQSFDLSKWHCALWLNISSRLCCDQTSLYPHHKMGGGYNGFALSRPSVGRLVRSSVRLHYRVRSINPIPMKDFFQTWLKYSP